MNPSYPSIDACEGWDDFSWLLEGQNIPTSYEAQCSFQQQDVNDIQANHSLTPHCGGNNYDGSSDVSMLDVNYIPQHCQTYQGPSWTLPSSSLQTSPAARWGSDIFDQVPPRLDPPDTRSLQRQAPRFEGDLYTAPYIKGEGVERAGWCSFCSTWHKLKDSAYWYHMHYSHGVSCQTGRQLTGPQKMQWNFQVNCWQALCARCSTWLTLGRGDKAAKTAYYRHAYQCYFQKNPHFARTGGVKKSRSPRRLLRNDSGHFQGGQSYP